ncbi:B3 domain-containing protein Os01g0234100-like [Papaver somniferum]|uniref:B3 domain-containing protein Os01g0234100-like n=1 Tax=Papaver somniferum TaxID=3469 RepID=UPI000E6F81F0|nr:B3 domain-containing protein Os01g0234100-like [Papaver somniferum]
MEGKQKIPKGRFLKRMTRSSTKETDSSLTKVVPQQVVHNPTKEKKRTRSKTLLTATEDHRNKSLAQVGAEEIQSSLNPKYPSFIKIMLPSHVSNGFWLGLPATFCSLNLPKEDFDLTLLDEDGEEHTVKCLPRKFGLSGGWGTFSRVHKLAAGDAVVFQLVEATKFKVYIVRGTRGLACDIPEEGSDIADHSDAKERNKRKRVSSHPTVPLPGEDQDSVLSLPEDCNEMEMTKRRGQKQIKSDPSVPLHGEDRDVTLPLESSIQPDDNGNNEVEIDLNIMLSPESSRQPEGRSDEEVIDRNITLLLASSRQLDDHSSEEVIDSEVLERIKFSDSTFEVQDVTNLESFTIVVNGLIIDSEISANVRTKYYELCCSQKTHLHRHLIQGMNSKLVAGMICETVNIADAIRGSKLSTPKDEYKAWQKSLIGFKHLGMNVEFLLSRLDMLLKLALESEHALEYNEQDRAKEEELSTLEKRILELRNESTRLEKEVETLKVNAEKHEAFHNVVNSPW